MTTKNTTGLRCSFSQQEPAFAAQPRASIIIPRPKVVANSQDGGGLFCVVHRRRLCHVVLSARRNRPEADHSRRRAVAQDKYANNASRRKKQKHGRPSSSRRRPAVLRRREPARRSTKPERRGQALRASPRTLIAILSIEPVADDDAAAGRRETADAAASAVRSCATWAARLTCCGRPPCRGLQTLTHGCGAQRG